MKREDLHWIIPLLETLRDNPDAILKAFGRAIPVDQVQFNSPPENYSVHIPRKYRLYKRRGEEGNFVFCVTADDPRARPLEKDPSVTFLTDWLPVPTGP